MAQRLVRQLCPFCKVPYTATEEDLLELGIDLDHVDEELARLRKAAASSVHSDSQPPQELDMGDLLEDEPTAIHQLPVQPLQQSPQQAHLASNGRMPTFYRAVGCDECGQMGYRGRQGIYELMVIDEAVRKAILANSDAKTIQRAARPQGMRTLREDGARQVIAGVTSVDEVLAATQASELEAAE